MVAEKAQARFVRHACVRDRGELVLFLIFLAHEGTSNQFLSLLSRVRHVFVKEDRRERMLLIGPVGRRSFFGSVQKYN